MNKKLLALLLVGVMAGNVYAAESSDNDNGDGSGSVNSGANSAAGVGALGASLEVSGAPLGGGIPGGMAEEHARRQEVSFGADDRAQADDTNKRVRALEAQLNSVAPEGDAVVLTPQAFTGKKGWKGVLSYGRSLLVPCKTDVKAVDELRVAGVQPATYGDKALSRDADATRGRNVWTARATRVTTLIAYSMLARAAAGTVADFFVGDDEDEDEDEDNA